MADNYYSSHSQPTLPLHLCFFLLILFSFVSFTWYINYENIFEPLFDQIKLVLMVSPLLLLLAMHLLSSLDRSLIYLPFPEQDSLHRAGGTPWGVGLLLVILLFMVSYQSGLRERWFPLLSRWWRWLLLDCGDHDFKWEYLQYGENWWKVLWCSNTALYILSFRQGWELRSAFVDLCLSFHFCLWSSFHVLLLSSTV